MSEQQPTFDFVIAANRLPVDRVVNDDGSSTWRRSPAAKPAQVRARYSASWSISPVRMRITRSSTLTKILPSPILPVPAAWLIASTTRST